MLVFVKMDGEIGG